MAASSTDRIEKKILLRAPRARVWRALADAKEFGTWFGVKLEGTFAPGARITGKVLHPDYAHVPFDLTIERMEHERLLSWRAPPHPVEKGKDDSNEPSTLVVFELEDVPGGTMLTVVESGFDGIPLSRRAEAYRGNEEGWTIQMGNIERYVRQAA
ncbi:SRPBCC family protein [Stigmatella aurantiaca]|uniref:Activator of Hsp90 ATPase-like protein n=1 Tax=Stigmatella aurantiaca (strain DW4/3-1) TaxID=378806 RepID=Q094F2_STIAD|nr:SRPBCC family protein [Stigmatella aurantiaca]ADO68158.1 Activator of Hsp90 ATPase-like protein [Stigmatella aurantiaca DW4/3-1]EAU67124.1 Aha1 domain superfamily [Stigmatella aurantiaca DW4/3-1]